jgi:hypothetical protein
LAFAENPQLPANPHGFLTRLDIPAYQLIIRGAHEQIATFFTTDGATVIHPEPARFFETPIRLPLPEHLNYPGTIATGNPPRIHSVVINDGSAQRSMVNSLTITLDRNVTFDPGAFGLLSQNGSIVGLNVATSVMGGRTVAVLTFTGSGIIGGSLADGNYTLTIRGDHIRDSEDRKLDGDRDGIGGGDRRNAFFRLFGDSDGDRDVDLLDWGRFLSTLGRRQGNTHYLDSMDFDGDDCVGVIDLLAFARRLGRDLDP